MVSRNISRLAAHWKSGLGAIGVVLLAQAALAQQDPENLLPDEQEATTETAGDPNSEPMAEIPLQTPEPAIASWSVAAADNLLAVIKGIGAEGLKPADYKPDTLSAAIATGEGAALNAEATRALTWLVEDLRDGRTPNNGRHQWFVVDPDSDTMPTATLLAQAKESGDIAALVAALAPVHEDYGALKAELAKTPAANTAKRKLIMANMDRWRWLGRDLGKDYLRTNVPEYMLRFVVNKQQISTYRTIVGKPGKTATPQLAEMVEGVVFNPTWTVPQSIVKGEGLGARVMGNPAWARSMGYVATKGANGYVSVVQQPGPRNALGMMKLHMPNEHAIFLHDTPSRGLFNQGNRALSHGCVRTERALELAMTIAIVQGDMTSAQTKEIVKSLKYRLVPVKRALPVYITYFTMATDVNGQMRSFSDIYGRDKAVLDAMAAPRPLRSGKMKQTEEVVAIEAPGA